MAVTENRGGANGGPQYNPMNINPMGGDGQSGNIDYTGFGYSVNKEVNEQRKAFPLKSQPTGAKVVAATPDAGPAVIGIDEPSRYPDRPVTSGGALGDGAGEEALGLPAMSPVVEFDSGINAVRALYLQDPNNQDLKRILEFVDRPGVIP